MKDSPTPDHLTRRALGAATLTVPVSLARPPSTQAGKRRRDSLTRPATRSKAATR